MAHDISSQESVFAETVSVNANSSQQSTSDIDTPTPSFLNWQSAQIGGSKGPTRYWIVEPTKVCSDFCNMQMKVCLIVMQSD